MQEQLAERIIQPGPVIRPERHWRIAGMRTCRAPRTRVEHPQDGLAHLVTRHELWTPPHGAAEQERRLWVLPGEARLLIAPSGNVSALIGNRRYESLPPVALLGPTSRATRLSASGGMVAMVGLSALGWAGFVGRSAATLGDRVVPAAEVMDPRLVAELSDAFFHPVLDGLTDRLDAVFGATPMSRCADEPLIRGLTEIIDEGAVHVAEAAGEQLGVASHVVRRSALRHFGYPPKVLLNRRRFVDALERMILSSRGYSEAARHGYFDASHFIRDSKRFLGMTPRRFLHLAA